MRTLSAFLVAILSPMLVHAATWGSRGVSQAFALNGGNLYVADGRGVSLYDVSNPSSMKQLQVEPLEYETRDLSLAESGILAVATSAGFDWYHLGEGGLMVHAGRMNLDGGVGRIVAEGELIAVDTPKSIRIFRLHGSWIEPYWTYATKGAVKNLLFENGLLYASFDQGGVLIFNADACCDLLGQIAIKSSAISLQGQTLWVVTSKGLDAYDVADPARPERVGRIDVQGMSAARLTTTDTAAFVLEPPDRVRAFDITDRENPRQVSLLHDWAGVILASGSRLYLAGSMADDAGLPPRETGIPVKVYDTTDLESIRQAGELHDLAGPVSGVFTDGTLAYVVDPPYFRVLDVSKTDDPREIASILVPDIQDRVRARGGLAIVYGRGSVNLIDVANPYAPRLLGTYDTPGRARGSAALLRDAFVEVNEESGLHVVDYAVDLASPSQPVHEVDGEEAAGAFDVAAGDDAIYALQAGNLSTLDASDPSRVIHVDVEPGHFAQIETIPPSSANPEDLVLRKSQGVEIRGIFDRFELGEFYDGNTIAIPQAELIGTSEESVYVAKGDSLLRIDVRDRVLRWTGMSVVSPMQISGAKGKVVVADRYSVRVYGPDTAAPPPPPPPPPPRRRAVGRG